MKTYKTYKKQESTARKVDARTADECGLNKRSHKTKPRMYMRMSLLVIVIRVQSLGNHTLLLLCLAPKYSKYTDQNWSILRKIVFFFFVLFFWFKKYLL